MSIRYRLPVPEEPKNEINPDICIPKEEGLYVRLHHGRNSPDQDMEDWGFGGPCIGPLQNIHRVYGFYQIYPKHDGHKEGQDFIAKFKLKDEWPLELDTHDDMILWDEMYFGDADIFYHKPEANE